jgi:maleate isomerase
MPRIGMLTPSSNTVLEPVTMQLLAGLPGVTAHFSRFRVTQIALSEAANAQFDDSEILRAANLLADAKVDVISWNGTSASWLGFERDHHLKERIETETGIKASTCVLSLLDILTRLGAKQQALVTPYTRDVQQRIIANYASAGFACPAERHSGLSDNFSFARVPKSELREMAEAVAVAKPDAITILCTNLDGASLAPEIEVEHDILVLDSVAVTLWGCLMEVGVRPDSVTGWGRIFTDPRLNPET